jgi:hypothetical protein
MQRSSRNLEKKKQSEDEEPAERRRDTNHHDGAKSVETWPDCGLLGHMRACIESLKRIHKTDEFKRCMYPT